MNLVVVPGDGIGPEITDATMKAVRALEDRFGLTLDIQTLDSGLASLKKRGVTLRDEDIETARRADGVILGPMSVAEYPAPAQGGINVPARYRTGLNLYANVRPCYTRPGVPSMAKKMDLVFVRENVEDFYVDRNMYSGVGEFMPTPDVVLAVGKITAEGSRRAARVACELASRRPRKRLTIVHKAPVLKLYNGLFLNSAKEVAKQYPSVQVDDLLVDAVAALLVRTPERFDVVLTTNTFGDILTDEASELAGSLGLAASLNHGDDCAVAQAGHGSAPDIAGKDSANPTSLILSTAMLFEHMGAKRRNEKLVEAARCLQRSVDAVLEKPETRTRDLGGVLGTRAFADAVVKRILQ